MHSNEVMEDVFLKADGIVADYWTQLKQHTNPCPSSRRRASSMRARSWT